MIPALAAFLLAVIPGGAEGNAQAFTSLTDTQGRILADGRYSQWVTNGVLHIEARYDFPGGRVAIEQATLRLTPHIEQESWRWSERDNKVPLREMTIDFRTGKARVEHYQDKEHWEETFKIEPGYTFAGIGFITAIKAMRDRLPVGQSVELKAIAMTPKPREATVQISHDGPQRIRMADREIAADRFTIHPQVPAIAKLFVNVPDLHIWLVAGKPAAFLRYEGPLVENDDAIVHVDLIAGPPAAEGRRGPR
jgi:hypothetical protein